MVSIGWRRGSIKSFQDNNYCEKLRNINAGGTQFTQFTVGARKQKKKACYMLYWEAPESSKSASFKNKKRALVSRLFSSNITVL